AVTTSGCPHRARHESRIDLICASRRKGIAMRLRRFDGATGGYPLRPFCPSCGFMPRKGASNAMAETTMIRGEPPSPRIAELLATRREILIERWTSRVLADPAVPEANRLSAPALRNQLPGFIDHLIDALLRRGTGESTGRALGSGYVAVAHAR